MDWSTSISSTFCVSVVHVLSVFSNFAIEKDGCFTFIVFLVFCDCWCLFLPMPWAGLLCVFALFPNHAHLDFYARKVCSDENEWVGI